MQKILDEDPEKYITSVVIPEKEIDRTKFKKGIEGFIPTFSIEEEERYKKMDEEETQISSLSLQDLMNEINGFGESKMQNNQKENEEKALNQVAKTSQKLFKGLFKSIESCMIYCILLWRE